MLEPKPCPSLFPTNGNGHAHCEASQLRIVESDAGLVHAAPGNPEISPDVVTVLMGSIAAIGQQVLGIVYPHPDRPGEWLCPDGNHRAAACKALRIPFKAVAADHPLTRAEVRRIRVTTNAIRRRMTPDQLADELEAHMAETGDDHQGHVAAYFGLSEGYVSKLLSPVKNLDPSLHHLRGKPGICRDVLRIIASMPTPELQKALAEKVTKLAETTGMAKRDVVAKLAEQMKGGGRGGRKAKPIKLALDGVVITILKHDFAVLDVALMQAKAMKAKAEKNGLPITSLPDLKV